MAQPNKSVDPEVAAEQPNLAPQLDSEMLRDMPKEDLIAALQKSNKRENAAASRLAKLEDENLKLTDKLKKSALTDKDKRELTMAVKTTATDIMDPVRYEQLRILARDMFGSGQVPSTYESEAQVFSAMQIGTELGMGPREAVLNGYFIGGRYELWGKSVGALLRRKGWRWKFTNDNDEAQERAEVELTHSETGETITDEFTFEEAELSGFTTKNSKYGGGEIDSLGWKPGSNRKRKLRYGVLSLVLHTYLPDVLGSATGIAEYSEDYFNAQDKADAADKSDARENRKATINKAMAGYNGKPLQEVTPRAVGVDAAKPGDDRSEDTPHMAEIARKTAAQSTGDPERDAQDIQ